MHSDHACLQHAVPKFAQNLSRVLAEGFVIFDDEIVSALIARSIICRVRSSVECSPSSWRRGRFSRSCFVQFAINFYVAAGLADESIDWLNPRPVPCRPPWL